VYVCFRDFGTDPMTFIYEPEPYLLNMYPSTKSELSMPRLSKVIVLHTYICYRNYCHATVSRTVYSTLEALRNALYKCSTYLLTYV